MNKNNKEDYNSEIQFLKKNGIHKYEMLTDGDHNHIRLAELLYNYKQVPAEGYQTAAEILCANIKGYDPFIHASFIRAMEEYANQFKAPVKVVTDEEIKGAALIIFSEVGVESTVDKIAPLLSDDGAVLKLRFCLEAVESMGKWVRKQLTGD
ncbi:hypothetical protein [Pedobacter antarcticus]|uniref:hypothetical protein n=1 Tax=Pedobacter antarcticus TaxID=34086 RepID=UPI00088EAF50|nr:hypothetical protein [Pedobacter antarcticus]SDM40028.1 hypothetical protein SAMN04488084_106153 [Pedobacter antarcticus]